jgi:hypothetical protein
MAGKVGNDLILPITARSSASGAIRAVRTVETHGARAWIELERPHIRIGAFDGFAEFGVHVDAQQTSDLVVGVGCLASRDVDLVALLQLESRVVCQARRAFSCRR